MLLIGFRSASGGFTVVSAANPLPVTGGGGGGGGDASAANQVTGNASLASIDTKLTNNATSTLQTALNTLVGAANAAAWASGDSSLMSLLKAIATAAIATAATMVQHVAYATVRTITPGTNVTAGKALMVNCTTAGTLTIELQGGNTLAVAVAVGPAFFDKLAAIDIAWSGGGAGTAYVLDA